jgi:predicted HNH restriction endonuclease
MEKALFINGVYEIVLEEIVKSQENNSGMVFYLQPYSASSIKQLKNSPPDAGSPMSLYLSTTIQLNQICYIAKIVGWEDKNELSKERLDFLNNHIKKFQPEEGEIFFQVNGKKCVNLISIINLKKVTNQLSVANLIKESNGEPLKNRSRSGGWSYVHALPLLEIERTIVSQHLHEELESAVSKSLKDDDKSLKERLANAAKIPEKIQTISFEYRRNPDVVAVVLKRANGKCELCKLDAPFLKASDRSPYLEVHHWISLSEGGEDTIDNAGALCPNCHKHAHFGQYREHIKSNKALAADAKELRG